MIKNYGYAGVFRNDAISVDVVFENPLNYAIDASVLVFSVKIKPRNGKANAPQLDEFRFYIMTAYNRLYNAETVPITKLYGETDADAIEPSNAVRGLIQTEFKPEYLYQNLRMAFLYQAYNHIEIIPLMPY